MNILMLYEFFFPWVFIIFYSLLKETDKNALDVVAMVYSVLFTYVVVFLKSEAQLVWLFLFWISFVIMLSKKYTLSYSFLIAMCVTLFSSEVWELPIHIRSMLSGSILLTFILTSPRLLMLIPFFKEAKKFYPYWIIALNLVIIPIFISEFLLHIEASNWMRLPCAVCSLCLINLFPRNYNVVKES